MFFLISSSSMALGNSDGLTNLVLNIIDSKIVFKGQVMSYVRNFPEEDYALDYSEEEVEEVLKRNDATAWALADKMARLEQARAVSLAIDVKALSMYQGDFEGKMLRIWGSEMMEFQTKDYPLKSEHLFLIDHPLKALTEEEAKAEDIRFGAKGYPISHFHYHPGACTTFLISYSVENGNVSVGRSLSENSSFLPPASQSQCPLPEQSVPLAFVEWLVNGYSVGRERMIHDRRSYDELLSKLGDTFAQQNQACILQSLEAKQMKEFRATFCKPREQTYQEERARLRTQQEESWRTHVVAGWQQWCNDSQKEVSE